jgi:membrane protease YdiL (CAAX protease family)
VATNRDVFVIRLRLKFRLLLTCVEGAHARRGGGLYVLGIMWCPALAGMATLKLNGRNLSELGWKWPATGYAAKSWLIPLLYAFIAYVVVWSTGLGGFPNHDFMAQLVPRMGLPLSPAGATALYILIGGTFGAARGLASALGEEIGWRGFLVPELSKKLSFTGTALLSGAVWSCWHYPLLIWGDYNSGTPTWYGLSCFTALVISISFVFAWLRLKSGSLWTGALLHAESQSLHPGVLHSANSATQVRPLGSSTNSAPFCQL